MKPAAVILFLLYSAAVFSQKKITVSQTGKADYKTIQGAINSLPDSANAPRVIFIRNGEYKEKIYIEKDFVTLEGESKAGTVITRAIARDEWRCDHRDDWGAATVNVDGDDISFKNLTIINSYGFDNKEDKRIICASDTTAQRTAVIRANGHQMALRTLSATRFKAVNCSFRAFAGDTVSPWNVDNGMFYFKDCDMEGGVDFYCPRGWAYAENCSFKANGGTASIWHDGSANKDSKTVLVNCRFTGFEGFMLGRFHRDAQFYLLDCKFSSAMADKDIYLVPTENVIRWGKRVYYSGCRRTGGDYPWFADNLSAAPGNPDRKSITVNWVFADRWNPLKY